jgi:uncharacterized protein DUF3185
MSQKLLYGIVLLVVGAVLVVVGMNASHSAADQISNTFTGRFTRETICYFVGGGAAALLGLLMVVGSARGKNA